MNDLEGINITVTGLFIGPKNLKTSEPVDQIRLTHAGVVGDRHRGQTKIAGVREKPLPKGVIVRNNRQLSAVTVEELAEMSALLGYEVSAKALGANFLFAGGGGITLVERQSHIFFEGGAVISVYRDNIPCAIAGQSVSEEHPEIEGNVAANFVKVAMGRRGIVGWVEVAGNIHLGETATIVPWTLPVHPAT